MKRMAGVWYRRNESGNDGGNWWARRCDGRGPGRAWRGDDVGAQR